MKYYEILDLPPEATEEQIKAAYRILVQLHHPDRLQQVSASVRAYAEERLKKINEAYRVLGDPDRRASYDATRRPRETAYASTFVLDGKGTVRFVKTSRTHGDRTKAADMLAEIKKLSEIK